MTARPLLLLAWLIVASEHQPWAEQKFETKAECEATLAWYRANEGTVGVCVYNDANDMWVPPPRRCVQYGIKGSFRVCGSARKP